MSTTSGFFVGLVCVLCLAIVFAGRIDSSRSQMAEQLTLSAVTAQENLVLPDAEAPEPSALPSHPAANADAASSAGPERVGPPEDTGVIENELDQRWRSYWVKSKDMTPLGEFPWRPCFARAAASYELPESLLLAIARGESNFDPAARSNKNAVGLMQIRWPQTARHLGIQTEAELYDPCTNVDAGSRYLLELLEQFDQNLHLAIAAYNYGPARIKPGQIPDGARWYSNYIYEHLQRVLGGEASVAAGPAAPEASGEGGRQLLMRFNGPHRADDFLAFLRTELPELNLQRQGRALGHYEVLLFYRSEAERLRAMQAITDSGVAIINTQSSDKLSL